LMAATSVEESYSKTTLNIPRSEVATIAAMQASGYPCKALRR
jgi:hypothetical protein